MLLRTRIFFLLLLLPFFTWAQTDSSHLRISLLTVSPGDEIWATFGHDGLRVTDSLHHTDLVFNYGTFQFDKDFEWKFTRGKLLYSISAESFIDFIGTYVAEQRGVEEQQILLNGPQKESLYRFLLNNMEPENRSYKYDFLFDNCATRLRDVFPKTFGQDFRYGRTLPPGSRITFRNTINRYLYRQPWERFGINMLLGRTLDRRMSNEDAMFLPDYLREGIGNAQVGGRRVATAPVVLLPAPPPPNVNTNGPLILTICIAVLTIAGLSSRKLQGLGRVMSTLLLVVSGLLGCLMLFMWLGTDHQACQNNWNVLWALPTNILLPFMGRRGKDRYAVLAILLLLTSVLLHVAGIQELPLRDLWPLLLALLYVYGMIYRRHKGAVSHG